MMYDCFISKQRLTLLSIVRMVYLTFLFGTCAIDV